MASDTRDRILASAGRLFQEHGFHGTSISAILEDAGVNSGSLYHFFDTKEALLEGVVARHLQFLGPTILDPAQAIGKDPVERIATLLDRYRRSLLGSDFDRGCPVGALALEVGDDMATARSLINEYFSAWTARVVTWLEAAGDRLPTGLDHGGVARLVLAVMQGAMMQARAAPSIEPFDATVAQLQRDLETLTGPSGEQLIEAPAVSEEEKIAPAEEQPPDSPSWRSW